MEMDDLDEFVALHADPEVTRFIRPFDRAAAETACCDMGIVER